VNSLQLPRIRIDLPVFFPAVSSVKDDHDFASYMALLATLGARTALTSAYDWSRIDGDTRDKAMGHYVEWLDAGTVMIMDSGRYEAYWHRDPSWSHEEYVACALELWPSLAMSFDEPVSTGTAQAQATAAVRSWERDQTALGEIPVVPIVHGGPGSIAAAAAVAAASVHPVMVAVAERELGEGVVARATTVRAIRHALDDHGETCPIHLLGAGSPTSVLIYSVAGAESFDGLEWNRTVVDFETARLHHRQHYDFFEHQTPAAGTGSHWGRTIAHNLIFWAAWIDRIRRGEGPAMVDLYVPDKGKQLLSVALPELLG
jgi:queuine/archaeosine tRNA-ribosyltransferase